MTAIVALAWFARAHTALVLASAAVAVHTTWVVLTRARQFLKPNAFHTRSGRRGRLRVRGGVCSRDRVQPPVAVLSCYSVVTAASS